MCVSLSLYRWEFRLTLKIIAKMLREVVNRVKLCGHHTVRCSHVEVQSHVVVRRRGTLVDLLCWRLGCSGSAERLVEYMDTKIVLSLEISSHSEDHRENATRSGKQSEIGRSARPKAFTR